MNREQYIKRLEEVKKESLDIVRRKNADYARDDDPFANFRLCDTLGVCSVEQGLVVRICDKVSRIAQLLRKNPDVVSEKIDDTARDLANYADILAVWLEQKRENAKIRVVQQENGDYIGIKDKERWTPAN